MPVSLWSETQADILFLTHEKLLETQHYSSFCTFWVYVFEISNHVRILKNVIFTFGRKREGLWDQEAAITTEHE